MTKNNQIKWQIFVNLIKKTKKINREANVAACCLSFLEKKNHNELHERANGEKRSAIFEVDNLLKLTETKHEYMHIFACRFMIKYLILFSSL